ncbi:MAG TPA: NAD(P)-dependent oxidoreductase [Burkholderiales bacterium]|jgi:3-hydroxyisobutyrate dehydrogenase-like beta-hydroxyacid dehydrogenase|nr:NAD(P)-dependent oxidoreductase [Burkholderiales bacterium]
MATLPRIGWIGAGRMGVPMAGFVLKAGYPVAVFSRTATNRGKLVAQGAQEATSIAQCAAASDIVFSSIPDDAALGAVALGPQGVLASLRRGGIFADTSTVSPEASSAVAEEAQRRGVAYLRIPISGNAASAQKGEVTALVSGPAPAWNTVKPVVETFSKVQVYLGEGEEARYMKLVINALVVNLAQGMAEAFALGRKAGLRWSVMLDTIGQSTLASPWLKAKVALMKARDFSPTMTTRLILKDLDLILAAARATGVPMPLTAVTRQMMQAAVGEGYGEDDYLSTIKLMEKQSGLRTDRVE